MPSALVPIRGEAARRIILVEVERRDRACAPAVVNVALAPPDVNCANEPHRRTSGAAGPVEMDGGDDPRPAPTPTRVSATPTGPSGGRDALRRLPRDDGTRAPRPGDHLHVGAASRPAVLLDVVERRLARPHRNRAGARQACVSGYLLPEQRLRSGSTWTPKDESVRSRVVQSAQRSSRALKVAGSAGGWSRVTLQRQGRAEGVFECRMDSALATESTSARAVTPHRLLGHAQEAPATRCHGVEISGGTTSGARAGGLGIYRCNTTLQGEPGTHRARCLPVKMLLKEGALPACRRCDTGADA